MTNSELQVDLETVLLDEVLNNPSSSAQLDHLASSFPSEDLIELGIKGGAIEAFGIGRLNNRSGMSEYNAGIHSGLDIIASSVNENDSPILARNPRRKVVPYNAHVVLDVPERTELLTGDYEYKKVANFVLALCRHVADIRGAELSVYYNNGESSGLLFDGESTSAYMAEIAMEQEPEFLEESDPHLEGLLELAESRIDPKYDGLFVVSDFQDGFDADTESFNWENILQTATMSLNDRAWMTRINSNAHRSLPYGVITGLDSSTVRSMNAVYSRQAEVKDKVITEVMDVLQPARSASIDLSRKGNSDHPVRLLTTFVLGQVYN